jgi:hypothetical protein
MTNPTLTLGGGNWAVEEDFVLGYKINEELNKYIPREISATRTSDGLAQDSTGVLRRYPWNLSQFSEQFENAHFAKQNSSIISNVGLSPINTLTADKLVPNTTLGQHRIFNQVNFSGPGTFSVYAKADGYNFLSLGTSGGISGGGIYFNLSNGTISGTAPGFTPSIQNIGNGWYRCSLYSDTMGAGLNLSYWIIARETASLSDFTGDDTKGILIWGAQINEGSILPYFRTTNRQDVLRVDYSTGQPALLLEPSRTNILYKSEEFDNAYFTKRGGSSIISNTTISPNNTTTADTLQGDGTSGFKEIIVLNLGSNLNAGTTYTYSFYAKKNTNNFIQLIFTNSVFTGSLIANYNLDTGVLGTVTAGVTATITSVGNGWYRCTATATATSTSSSNGFIIGLITSATSARAEVSTLSTSVFIWGVQLEAGSYATTYIPNYSSSTVAVRNTDGFIFNNIYTNGFINASGGTWFIQLRNNIEYVRDAGSSGLYISTILGSGVGANSIEIRNPSTSSGRLQIFKRVLGSGTMLSTTSTDIVKVAIKWNGTRLFLFVNGDQITLSGGIENFAATTMEFLADDTRDVPRFIQKMELYNTPLSDTELETLTTL